MIKRGRGRRYDVAFYVPRLAPLLVSDARDPTGGAETQVLLLARALAQRGVKVCLIVFDLPGVTIPESIGNLAVLVRPPYQARLRLGKLLEVKSIHRAIAEADAGVVVTRMSTPEVGVAALFAKLLRRRFVHSSASLSDFIPETKRRRDRLFTNNSGREEVSSTIVANFDISRLRRKRRDWELFRLAIHLADNVVVQTEEQVRLCQTHFRRSPVLIRSIAEPTPERKGDPEAFLWIGRGVESKRPDAFVELAHSLPEAEFRMVVVPSSDRRDDMELMTAIERSAATTPNLRLLSPRPRGELLELVNNAVAIVNTSDFEGMPNTFLEGWARGVPALALAHDPDGVIARHNLGAFADGSRECFAHQASLLWRDRGNQEDIATRCRQYILDYHSPEAVSALWLDVLGLPPKVQLVEAGVA